jgi:hypothetical protein
MARARNIKPGFFTNDVLAELDPLTRLLFAGLWTIADRDGRLEDRPKKIKAQVLPYDSCNCGDLLQSLHETGFILRYEAEGGQFIQIVKWCEHQNPHIKEANSTIPAPCKNSAQTEEAPKKEETSPADSLNPLSDSLNPSTSSKPAARGDAYTSEFEEAWVAYPSRPGASKKESFKAWNARLKAGVDVEDLIAGVRGYAHYVSEMKTDPQFIKQPATFFGPDEHYKADWTAMPRASPAGRPEKFDPTAYVNRPRMQPNERTIELDPTGEPV